MASFAIWACVCAAAAQLQFTQDGHVAQVEGEHFRLTVDPAKGGEITALELYDGVTWNAVIAPGETSFPSLRVASAEQGYALANDAEARLVDIENAGDCVRFGVRATPRATDGAAAPWETRLAYEVYPEGAVFISLTLVLRKGEFALASADVAFEPCQALQSSPKFRNENVCIATGGFRSARVAFSKNPALTFTNEIEVEVENKEAIAGGTGQEQQGGRVTWKLGGDAAIVKAPFTYHNRFALGMSRAVTGKPKSNVIGQRVYHWVNWLDKEDWYCSNEQIDKMVANNATMLILHHEWMLQRGSNGHPHADYSVVRDDANIVRMIDYAHAKGLRVGLYMRGVEPYALDTGFFTKYLRRNYDGLYVDWHGAHGVSYHDNHWDIEQQFEEKHFSEDGSCTPCRAYFLFTKRLRDVVGPDGFLIGHQGSFNAGILANLCFDAYLPGETGSDRKMLADIDEAGYKGMLGGSCCMPWTLDLPDYRNAEGAAKMAAWGLYPHIVMGIEARQGESVTFSLDPDDPLYAFVLPYWWLLAQIDVTQANAYNAPAQNPPAATCSSAALRPIIYKTNDAYLVIVANLGTEPAKGVITLDTKVLGMKGAYAAERLDAATRERVSIAPITDAIDTGELGPWGLVAFLLQAN
ncbi:MAG TPA: hypothetical protein PLO37_07115 [Candidatus Hydrogenedentes bacterium]|nr:hypothetical protein [Candidatus Hydrogenedentota bacterium]HPG66601.1 hypothetical protein [Candidatus Hydrogenedentota bacterium]